MNSRTFPRTICSSEYHTQPLDFRPIPFPLETACLSPEFVPGSGESSHPMKGAPSPFGRIANHGGLWFGWAECMLEELHTREFGARRGSVVNE